MWTVKDGKVVFIHKPKPYRRAALLGDREPRSDVVALIERNQLREVEE